MVKDYRHEYTVVHCTWCHWTYWLWKDGSGASHLQDLVVNRCLLPCSRIMPSYFTNQWWLRYYLITMAPTKELSTGTIAQLIAVEGAGHQTKEITKWVSVAKSITCTSQRGKQHWETTTETIVWSLQEDFIEECECSDMRDTVQTF